ncbi:MAG: hypothetical protein DU429_00635 [Candidatus Tokpelaia sp.]|uniref:hypothetical protein n=1 Tax=Candidatus Tokpelaia sp. TaxID=2233777 RepID=UPI00123C3472|nr:hypothetical protein [Candidatus Tokpelaia sp.]KAA6204820.1 MAG: hypothetical protein DU430_06760 [Candidatus Tokpelaia sp.]KAA6207605.1 MAG: hypothetical protein DU429_00635 [Candidatus Tokpelaia sp.]KAA6404776.1 hypothetical protein DPQ22_07565 [Candidatus Tokpelaia sp.]
MILAKRQRKCKAIGLLIFAPVVAARLPANYHHCLEGLKSFGDKAIKSCNFRAAYGKSRVVAAHNYR